MIRRMHIFATAFSLVAVLFAIWPGTAAAQYRSNQNEAGRFDYYTLVLSWSPTYCATLQRGDQDPQCDRRDGRPYAFVLHGLWPQHERGWPENCRTRERPFVPRPTIDRMLDIMPSPRLVIHEYRKHGTCSGMSPDAYYDYARKLFAKITVPPRYVGPSAPFFVSPGELENEFLAANPGLDADMIAVACNRSGSRLRDVRVCFSREGEFRTCGRNEEQRRLCRQARMHVPPVRLGARDEEAAGEAVRSSPLPGPLDQPGERRRETPQRF